MTIITPLGTVMIYGFIVLAVLATVVALAVLTDFVVTNRRARLTRHQSVRTYYRGLAVSH